MPNGIGGYAYVATNYFDTISGCATAFWTTVIFNSMGQEVAVIYQGKVNAAGKYQVSWNINDLPQGTYFCSLLTAGNRKIIKLTII
jgi:hypothetical protein